MYAIIVDGGRQYKVEEGQRVEIDYRDLPAGETVTFDRVLAVSTPGEGDAAGEVKLGSPTVEGASVTAEVLGTTQGKKIDVVKIRRRKNSRRHTGHRKMFTKVVIKAIAG
ncbi:MAG: 50S ribosomal protein L21 [Planctomycetota bacterium]